MLFKNKERRQEYQREWQRARRAGELSRGVQRSTKDLQAAQDMLEILAVMLSQLIASKADLFIKARTVAYVVSVGLKAAEVTELERRLVAL